MTKTGLSKKKTNINKANYRARQAAKIAAIKASINVHLAKLKRPSLDFAKKKTHHSAMKGRARPNYDPPAEEKMNMTEKEIRKWKTIERRKRKSIMERARRAKEEEEQNNLENMLIELNREVSLMTDNNALDIKQKSEPFVLSNTAKDIDVQAACISNFNTEVKLDLTDPAPASIPLKNSKAHTDEAAASALLFLSKDVL